MWEILPKYILPIIFFSFGVLCNDFQDTLGHLKSRAVPEVQALAAEGVIKRLLQNDSSLFHVIIDPDIGPEGREAFQVTKVSGNDTVTIIGSSGVAACWGFHHYLKHYCNCHVSWDSDQLTLPNPLPNVDISVTSVDRFRYYQNVCTTSYSFVWWDWTRWQREIDWMALNGFNFALAFNGQEAIWQRVYQKLNLSQLQIDEHFTGPAFLSWGRMGNIRGWGGPLPSSWHEDSLILQRRILNSMRALGIVPILPGFAGHVPRAFREVFPEANMTSMVKWNHFKDDYCCPYLLEPTDPLFRQVGNLFMNEMIAEFGTDHAYNCDTFNEMNPRTDNVTYIADVGSAIFQAMTDVDPEAVWVIQNWAFVHDIFFWTSERAQAFLTSVPIGRMIVLDLQSELVPQYFRLPSYYGQPFIWCMLHNFGGTLGMYGAAELVNSGLFTARTLVHSMVGIGLTPEGINQNYIMYDLMNDMPWRTMPVNLTEWFSSYALRRYGVYSPNVDRAWNILKSGVYNFQGLRKVRGKYVICRRPSLRLRPWDSVYNYVSGGAISDKHVIASRPALSLKERFWYNTTDLQVVWDEFLQAAPLLEGSANYQHDLVDVTRQCLQVLASGYYKLITQAYKERKVDKYQDYASKYLSLLEDLELLLASNKDFLLGTWLNSAKAKGTTPLEKELYEYNARNQITLWGPRGEIRDYAVKQWSGVVSHYFLPRWQLFLDRLNTSLIKGTAFNETQFNEDVFKNVEEPFTLDLSVFPDTPQGDSVAISLTLHKRWRQQKAGWLAAKRSERIPRTHSPQKQ
ncbi:alpha-N-acetylglucosaminidase isoform X3 [Anabrus simplex]|uniref:alpha-N-acetylglucosaminidase isoform X3 n=1 Tax=Anabrus simplex TaxID=316456 RepID=UPI0035A38B05